MHNATCDPANPVMMNARELNWCDLATLPEPGRIVLIHIPNDDEPVWFGFWDGRRWHYAEGLPVRAEVRHWCGLPRPPQEDWRTRDCAKQRVADLVGA